MATSFRDGQPTMKPSKTLSHFPAPVIVTLLICGLTGCGLAETAVSGSTGAAAEAQQAQQAQQIEQHVRDQVQAAQAAAAAQRDKAEQDAQ